MSLRPHHPCPKCKLLTSERGRCLECKRQTSRERDAIRKPDHDFYNSDHWRKAREVQLLHEPLCRSCWALGQTTPAVVVDHIQSRADRPDLEFERSNLQSLCKRCHDRKTYAENGSFGLQAKLDEMPEPMTWHR
jgi:5-methylcytosine-specific restriction enzyme A